MTLTEQIEEVQKLKQNPLPTAPVGWTVRWFDRNDPSVEYAAIVVGIEGPGQLQLTVFKPNHANCVCKSGVLHVSHPRHKDPSSQVTLMHGSWDYTEGQGALKSHKELHLDELTKIEAALKQSLRALQAQTQAAPPPEPQKQTAK